MTDLSALPREVAGPAIHAALNATDNSVTRVEASSPSTPGVTWILLALKVGLLIAGGYGISWAQDFMKWHAEMLPLIASVVATGGVGAWAFISKQIQSHREHQIALASAAASAAATQAAGRPEVVAVQPPPAKV